MMEWRPNGYEFDAKNLIRALFSEDKVDLNRDAIHLSQPESKVLCALFEGVNPDYALNLHGQRTIYGAGSIGEAATLSFLAPSADLERSVTPARAKAMTAIAAIHHALKEELPKGIGRYDDQFNPNCVGDSFTQAGTSILPLNQLCC